MTRAKFPRRTALRVAGVTVASALAGCFGGDTDDDDSNGGATDQPTEDPTEEPDDAGTDTPTDDATDTPADDPTDTPTDEPTEQATVVVAPDDDLRFDPETLEIAPGTVVEFVWEDGGHNIAVREQPDGADWGGVSERQDEGYTHTHTFEVEGRYDYVCEPHESSGMAGTVVVGDA